MDSVASVAALASLAEPPFEEALDGRRPLLLDHHGFVLQLLAGHADIFAVEFKNGRYGRRHHLFRLESGEVIPDLPMLAPASADEFRFIAVGSQGGRVSLVRRTDLTSVDPVARWIERLARFVTGSSPRWQMAELQEGVGELVSGECRRGPMRGFAWMTVERGEFKLMGVGTPCAVGNHPLPMTAALWLQAGTEGCSLTLSSKGPDDGLIWRSLEQFHLRFVACVRDILTRRTLSEAERLDSVTELAALQAVESFDRLSYAIVRRADHGVPDGSHSHRLFGACQIVATALGAPITIAAGAADANQHDVAALAEIAQTARFRLRQVQLRSNWWRLEAGPLVGWYGEKRDPVAIIYEPKRGYIMIDPLTKTGRPVDRALAMQIAPEAVTFYPTLPSRSLGFLDLLQFSLRYARGNLPRVALSIAFIGLLSLITPFVTNILISSIIPRSELDQLGFCALALGLTALSMAGIQVMQGLAMLRMEASIDWRLQSAVIDRLLRLPTSIFQGFTAGDLVDRSMGIDAARRALTGRALRGTIAGIFCLFSLGLMLYYDLKLSLIAIALTAVRAIAIVCTNAIRLHFEGKHFDQQGRVEGFVLQLLTGVGKLRVSAATSRALAIWSKQFARQKQYSVSSQTVGNALGAFETAFPTIATLTIFAYASYSQSRLMTDIGTFFAFFTAFGQTLGSVGAWAAGISEALMAIPPLRRLRPLIASATEVSDDRKSSGNLSGSIELARVSLRYVDGGPLVLDNVSMKIAPGEYVAIVGPSGSGKSSLFRLLLGFERPESGAVFYDGKSIETLDVSSVRRQLGVVLQNAKLANGSIYENICGGIRLPPEQAWEAARLAGMEDDIKAMPMGMLTQLSEGVNTLSGGQRQRILIARAIARRPRILLFDEATSSLDNRSQAIVSDALENLNVTRIVIAHRLSTVKKADRVIVLVDGRIVQAGTFSELSATSGVFASFAKRQML